MSDSAGAPRQAGGPAVARPGPAAELRLAVRMLWREWRAGELYVLAVALVLAVASVTTVGFFADRVQRALDGQASQILGADVVLISDHALPAAWRQSALGRGLKATETVLFPSMALVGDDSTLVDVKAVESGYPLRGRLRIAPGPGLPDREADGLPPRGAAWVGEALLARLKAKIGDRLQLGDSVLRIDALVTVEPDNALNYFNIAPRVLMNLADLPATGLVQTGSRITWRLALAGEREAVEAWRGRASSRLARGERLEGVRDARPEVRATLERADRFLGLAALLSVVLAGTAIALATRRFMQRHLDPCAVMRCLGAAQGVLLRLYLAQFALLALLAGMAGCALGWGAQLLLVKWMRTLVQVALPLPGPAPVFQGMATGGLVLIAFALPTLLQLRAVPTLRVIRRDLGAPRAGSLAAYGLGVTALALLLVWRAGEWRLGLYVVGGFAAAVALAAVLALVLVRWMAGLRRGAGGGWRLGLAGIGRRAGGSVVQIVALGLGMMALLVLTLVRTDLMSTWQKTVPPDAPNRFLINVQPEQLEPVQAQLRQRGMSAIQFHPMIRGRLLAINERRIDSAGYEDMRTRRLVEREFNLSSAATLRADNIVVAGRAWPPSGPPAPELSVEQGIAQQLGVKPGDSLTFDVAGTSVKAVIANLRKVDWDSFRVNFFVIASPGLLDQLPKSYITSFHLDAGREAVVNELLRAFPNLTVIDVDALVRQIQAMTSQVAQAIEFVFLFTLLAGVLVLYAAISATQDERRFESAIMRTLGARGRQLVQGQLAEFAAIGALAGAVAALGAAALSYVLSARVLNLPWHLNPWLPLVGVLGGAVLVAVAGLIGTRAARRTPPIEVIRGLN